MRAMSWCVLWPPNTSPSLFSTRNYSHFFSFSTQTTKLTSSRSSTRSRPRQALKLCSRRDTYCGDDLLAAEFPSDLLPTTRVGRHAHKWTHADHDPRAKLRSSPNKLRIVLVFQIPTRYIPTLSRIAHFLEMKACAHCLRASFRQPPFSRAALSPARTLLPAVSTVREPPRCSSDLL